MTRKPQLDHDGDGRPGGAKPAPGAEWVVTRGEGLIQVPADQVADRLRRGGRLPSARDFAIAGIAFHN